MDQLVVVAQELGAVAINRSLLLKDRGSADKAPGLELFHTGQIALTACEFTAQHGLLGSDVSLLGLIGPQAAIQLIHSTTQAGFLDTLLHPHQQAAAGKAGSPVLE